jgi:sugar lactone lactonase YvrE
MPDGRVFIADGLSSAVRGIDQGQLRTLGRATEVGGVAVDQHGNLDFSDRLGARVYKVGLQSGAVSVLAGTGIGGFGGDGGSADQALLSAPQGLAVDGDGNVYIADTGNERVRKVDTKGTISTLAGDGQTGFAGDGGASSSARLSSPAAVTVDGAGNVYIADTGNHRIREVTGTTISTLAGSGQGDSDGPQDSVPARSAHLGDPTALASTANGVVYVIDSFQLRKIEKGQVTYMAPPGSPA